MRGRRPKPTRLKLLAGNPGKRRLNADEPQPDPAIPDCPPELGPVARREWDRLAGELAALRLLTHLDRAALAAYCNAYALWADALDGIHKHGAMVKSPSGYPIQSPYIAIATGKPSSCCGSPPSSASPPQAAAASRRPPRPNHRCST